MVSIALAGAWIIEAVFLADRPSPALDTGTAPIEIGVASETDGSSARCSFPSVRPGYLPWPGRPPSPDRERDARWAVVSWSRGDVSRSGGPPLEGYVYLSRSTEDLGAIPPDPVVPLLLGRGGQIHRGAGSDLTLVWPDPFPPQIDDGCNETALTVNLSNLPYHRALREALRVARSLTPA
jgi:hypothetical protein